MKIKKGSLAVAAALLLFVSCSKAQTTYTIKKGDNYATPMTVQTHSGVMSMTRTVVFSPSCLYVLGNEDDKDLNKLFGFGYGLTSRASIRYAWRCNSTASGIDLFAYFHQSGKRYIPLKTESSKPKSPSLVIANIRPNEPVVLSVRNDEGRRVIFKATTGTRSDSLIIEHGFAPDWGFYLFPYFGGTSTAPHTMTITFTQ